MVDIGKLIHSKSGKTIMSILLGFGLATLFRSVCKNKECIVFTAPPLDDINSNTYDFDNKCYKYVPVQTKCNPNKKIITF